MNIYYLGLDIGGTKCAVLLGNESLDVLERVEIPTDHSMTPEQNIARMM